MCRGKVSEGLDFSDRAGRGVVLTGIPFSATHDPAIKLQRQVVLKGCFRGEGGRGYVKLPPHDLSYFKG